MTSAELYGFVDGHLPEGYAFDDDGAVVRHAPIARRDAAAAARDAARELADAFADELETVDA